jgi:hypothetical protein
VLAAAGCQSFEVLQRSGLEGGASGRIARPAEDDK